MEREKLLKQIAALRAEALNQAVQLGTLLGKITAFETMVQELDMRAAVEKAEKLAAMEGRGVGESTDS